MKKQKRRINDGKRDYIPRTALARMYRRLLKRCYFASAFIILFFEFLSAFGFDFNYMYISLFTPSSYRQYRLKERTMIISNQMRLRYIITSLT